MVYCIERDKWMSLARTIRQAQDEVQLSGSDGDVKI